MNPKFNEAAFSRLKSDYQREVKRPMTGKKKEKRRGDGKATDTRKFIVERESFFGSGKLTKTLFDGLIGAVLMFILTSSLVKKTLGMFIGGFYEMSQPGMMMPNHIQFYYRKMRTDKRKISMKGKLILAAIFVSFYVIIKNWIVVD